MEVSSDAIFAFVFGPFSIQLHFTFLIPPFSIMLIFLCLSSYASSHSQTNNKNTFNWYYWSLNNLSTGLLTSQNSPVVSSLWLFGMCFGTDLIFFELFKLYFLLGLIMTPHVSMFTWLMFIPLLHDSFFTRSHGQEKLLSYYDLFNFGVLFYRCIPTLISFYLLHNPTTPILPIYIDQRWPHLKEDTTRTQSMIIQKIPQVPRRTGITPD